MHAQKYRGYKYNQSNNQCSSYLQSFHYSTQLNCIPAIIIKQKNCTFIICFPKKPGVKSNILSQLQCLCKVERSIKTFILRSSIEQIRDFILNIFNDHDYRTKSTHLFQRLCGLWIHANRASFIYHKVNNLKIPMNGKILVIGIGAFFIVFFAYESWLLRSLPH